MKTSLLASKSEFALFQTLLRLFHVDQFVKCWQIFLEFNYTRLYQSSGKEKESCCLVITSSTKFFLLLRSISRELNAPPPLTHVGFASYLSRSFHFCLNRETVNHLQLHGVLTPFLLQFDVCKYFTKGGITAGNTLFSSIRHKGKRSFHMRISSVWQM